MEFLELISIFDSKSRRYDLKNFLLRFSVCYGVLLVAVTTGFDPNSVFAEESSSEAEVALEMPKLPDRLMLRAGWYYLFGSNATITTNTNLAGLGATVDFEDTLGGDTTASNIRADARYRFTKKHSLGFTYYRVAQGGNKVINQDILIEDTIIKAGASTTSGLSINLWRFFYNWSFYQNDKVELAISPGIYIADLRFDVSANATLQVGNEFQMVSPGTVVEEFTAPLPSVGGYVNYYISPRFNTELRADVFWLEAGSFRGSMVEFYAGAEYRIFDNFALGAAYDRLQVAVKIDDIDSNVGWNLVYLYGSLYFFSTEG